MACCEHTVPAAALQPLGVLSPVRPVVRSGKRHSAQMKNAHWSQSDWKERNECVCLRCWLVAVGSAPGSAASGCVLIPSEPLRPGSSSHGVDGGAGPRPGTSGLKMVPLGTGALGKPHRCLYLVVPLCENLFLGQECLSSNACVQLVCSPRPFPPSLYQPSEGGTG